MSAEEEHVAEPQAPVSLMHVSSLQKYLVKVGAPLLDFDNEQDNSSFYTSVTSDETSATLKKFIEDARSPVLLVEKMGHKANEAAVFSFILEVAFSPESVKGFALIKKHPEGILENSTKTVSSQVHLMNLGEGSPFELLHNYVHNSFTPFVLSYLKKTQKEDTDDKGGSALAAAAVRQKIAELEVSLNSVRTNVQIPTVVLKIHPDIEAKAHEAARDGVSLSPDQLGPLLESDQFLNEVQALVNTWIKDIHKITSLKRIDEMPESGETLVEVNFWLELEHALKEVDAQLQMPEALTIFRVLQLRKRAAQLTEKMEEVKRILQIVARLKPMMKDFPINDLLTAREVDELPDAILRIFDHLKKTARAANYPIPRYLRLLEAVSRDLCIKVLSILQRKRLMLLEYDEFDKVTGECKKVFLLWDEQLESFKDELRTVSRKRNEERTPYLKMNLESKPLTERVEALRKFRRQHNELRQVITRALPSSAAAAASGDIDAIKEVTLAFDEVKDKDVLQLSKAGTELFESLMKKYDSRIDRVESQITSTLREKLATARNAKEMFRVFSKFNALFVRPRIKAAIQQFQAQLIERVKQDINMLHEKFKQRYDNSEAAYISALRDLPPTAGKIIWARQLERQLNIYLKRVEDVLGKGWELDLEGAKLKNDGESFRSKLNVDQIFEQWLKDVNSKSFEVSGRILVLVQKGTRVSMEVNFDNHIITLFKEVRNLQYLGFKVPFTITLLSSNAKTLYPHAVSLKESLRTYSQSCSKITDDCRMLVASYKRDCQNLLTEGFQLKWENLFKLSKFASRLSEVVGHFRTKLEEVLVKDVQITEQIQLLRDCPLKAETISGILGRIQEIVDQLNLGSYSNLTAWVEDLDLRVQQVLLERLKELLRGWIQTIDSDEEERRRLAARTGSGARATADEQAAKARALQPSLKPSVHSIKIRNQMIYLDPPLERARVDWIRQLHAWLGVVCHASRIESSRYELTAARESLSKTRSTYADLLTKLPDGMLEQAYAAIEKRLDEVQSYANLWLQYQALWDMEAHHMYDQLGDDLNKWQQVIGEIRRSRSTFEASETHQKAFGPIIINYHAVHAGVSNKYDFWQNEILAQFSVRLGAATKKFYATISNARQQLERISVETATANETVSLVIQIRDLKRHKGPWLAELISFSTGQEALEGTKKGKGFQFPKDWLYYEQIDGEWNAFVQALDKKDKALANQIPALRLKVSDEEQMLEGRIKAFTTAWNDEKPLGGATGYQPALDTLRKFEGQIQSFKSEVDRVERAKEALDLPPGAPLANQVTVIEEEWSDLSGVWSQLAATWQKLNPLRETPWGAIVPRQIRKSLEDLLEGLKSLPNRVRSYAAYNHLQSAIKNYLKYNGIVNDLKSEALRDRHWKELKKRLNAAWVQSSLTLGDIWDSDLNKNEEIFKDVILKAQGELALEEFLRSVKEFWQSFQLDMVDYQKKCRLIRGWNDLFNKLQEHLGSLSSMKLSPFFKVFEEETIVWEDKLNRMRELFDIWIDVQRRWVYLEGIFSGSSDINALLPAESQRFKGINTEFINLMKKVTKNVLILEVLQLEGLQKSLERLADLLVKIQKALGEYLEKQRLAFPRFYFIGDEDLLEIIGNSKDLPKIQKHLRKMFAGLANLTLENDGGAIIAMTSREGEDVLFKTPVDLRSGPKINEWLTSVENEMRSTLAKLLEDAMNDFRHGRVTSQEQYLKWIDQYPAQLVLLASQCVWSADVEKSLVAGQVPTANLKAIEDNLAMLSENIMGDLPTIRRKKYEMLITELVHQRDVTRKLIKNNIRSNKDFAWLYEMRFYWDPAQDNILHKLVIQVANAKFYYGFEYLGVAEKLVQTPLTDRCYLTLTQALDLRLGGNPYGPAGTGKTESVKALGAQLGRFVLVFCCDETFDFQAMGRIFVGLCQVGAWGCFDEFNRLEERILSAVSQQVQTILVALKDRADKVELLSKTVKLNPDVGIFVTMNPGYAGRSNLPDNLKQLFRGIAMVSPDRELIAQVMLYSQGVKSAERLAAKMVPLFKLCNEQLSNQSHYDFGLRALKSVLVSAGSLKRQMSVARDAAAKAGQNVSSEQDFEQDVLIRSVCESFIPKLVAEDIPLLYSLLSDVFPGSTFVPSQLGSLRKNISIVCKARHLVEKPDWVEKLIQLYQVSQNAHGVMLVGPSGSGKSSAMHVLLEAMERDDGIKSVHHTMDPKAITKEALFGSLDSTTREWTDGLFTHTLRKIIDNVRGESQQRHWIVFDGDVDPEWVENFNSTLDDNKLFTLPNGERLALPSNVRIVFEVQDLKYATMATVSRCGMIWFSEEVMTTEMMLEHYLLKLRHQPLDETEADQFASSANNNPDSLPGLAFQRKAAALLEPILLGDGKYETIITRALAAAVTKFHIMDFTRLRVLTSMLCILNKGIVNVIHYNLGHSEFPLAPEIVERYLANRVYYALMWGFGGSMNLADREEFSRFLQNYPSPPLVPSNSPNDPPLLDYGLELETGTWSLWRLRVPIVEVESKKVGSPDVVIPTVDTVRHEEVLQSWLAEHRPLLLCGPPGSGKTMTLTNALNQFPDFEVLSLNFSSATTPALIMKTFEHHCEYKRTPKGDMVLRPTDLSKWLVIFCDEVNLPAPDNYGTQVVITFMRQLIEQGGFWRAGDHTWISLERIQFVGACNPPTDPGRTPLSHRFLRHCPLLLVDFPSVPSLEQIYGTFCRALMSMVPSLKGQGDALTKAMVSFYAMSQKKFTPDIQAHYIYSPRELSRWVRAIGEALKPLTNCSPDELVRIVVHEGLRLFQDRLVEKHERDWTDKTLDETFLSHFPDVDPACLKRPILYSNWLTKEYVGVDRAPLKEYVQARLKIFQEEELDVQLVIFNEVLDHILRIDRVFKQPQGHALLIGVSGGGKTVLSRFVAWLGGLSVFTIKVNNRYTAADFDEDLREVMLRSGTKDEKLVFIFDESNVLESSFLERMNTLLAGGEVPGLFEGEEWTGLMHSCKEGAQKAGLLIDSEDELYKWFTGNVRRNLHVVFTMNPAGQDFHNRAATSPALFNRCVLDWFGEWSNDALFQVAADFTRNIELDHPEWRLAPSYVEDPDLPMPMSHREGVYASMVYVHRTIGEANKRLLKKQGRQNYVTPRHYLDFIKHFVSLLSKKREELEDEQLHLNIGLQKLRDTEEQVKDMQVQLAGKSRQLENANALANEKLKQMVEDQQVAEQKKVASLELTKRLDEQNEVINVQKGKAEADLAKAEPALNAARSAVSSVEKKHLDEMKALGNPPDAVRKTMECVMYIVYQKKYADWNAVRKDISANFIKDVLTFSIDQFTPKARKYVVDTYFNDDKFTEATVNKSSKAAGPLVTWARALSDYAGVRDRIQPLREEVAQLEQSARDLAVQQKQLLDTIAELEKTIARYKEEYAQLISECQMIKTEMSTVKSKVDRSIALLAGLSGEATRWEQQRASFEVQMATVVGDVMLSAAFIAYIGVFDQYFRSALMDQWMEILDRFGIAYKKELSVREYLSTPDQLLTWQANGLPVDNLAVENAIMMERFNRYPLIIDPSGQAGEFLMNYYKPKKITKTSFLDTAFMKNLESALRFGTPLFVADVETVDPVLNPVLNREIQKKGGRILIKLGDKEVDFSPSFVIFMATRDPTTHFTPDLCSRVTFVNFTVTPSSLQSQCLYEVLKTERPEVHTKQLALIKAQGEFKVRLHTLEKGLLTALNEARGNILDDDKVLSTLETLKKEAQEISLKVEETEVVMEEINRVTALYNPMGLACSRIYFALEQLDLIHFLYRFSLKFFMDIFYSVLHNNNKLVGIKDPAQRLEVLIDELFRVIFARVSRGLLHDDHLTFALRLAQIRLKGSAAELDEAEFEFLLKGGESFQSDSALAPIFTELFPQSQRYLLMELKDIKAFSGVLQHVTANVDEWRAFLAASDAENRVPKAWFFQPLTPLTPTQEQIATGFHRLLVVRAARPDRVLAASANFVGTVFGNQLLEQPELDFPHLIDKESSASTPLILCSMPGYEAGSRVEEAAATLKRSLQSLAMGSDEGFALAEKTIAAGAKTGQWVMLRNVHLAPAWLVQLEKKLHSLQPLPTFRLFLTSEIHPKLPANLLRQSQVLVFEPPPGIKANLQHTFSQVHTARMDALPVERSRIYFLLAWLHAVLQERLRYAPLGWTKQFEFNDSDLRVALDTIDIWVDSQAQGRANVDPDKIPWTALRAILGQTVYGGKVDNVYDQRLLNSFLDQFFVPDSFNPDFPLMRDGTLSVPDGTKKEQFKRWIDGLTLSQTPAWLGLPSNAETLLLINKGKAVFGKLLRLQTVEQDSSEADDSESAKDGATDRRPAWMVALKASIEAWLKTLPESLPLLTRTADNIKNPLFRFFEGEINRASKLLHKVRSDLAELILVCDGAIKPTNYTRALLTNLSKGVVPKDWRKYSVPNSISLGFWIRDFAQRVLQLVEIRKSKDFAAPQGLWLGGLLTPEAFMTATRQAAAQANGWSLESLELRVEVLSDAGQFDPAADRAAFLIRDLCAEGAAWDASRRCLALSDELWTTLPPVKFAWRLKADSTDDAERTVLLPTYLNDTRLELLFAFAMPADTPAVVWHQRGVALSTWKSS
eukprot:TRINITY_DN1679_c0_g1_i1.p1 TRINITY_DN1679_c0_g1~~TRINITY_DN1679_c0_g1_i1.p1  ORF type:complete len:4594 (-),score=1709.56 TRINITY_DN1679_c0_g1_i1:318-14099(-)